MKHVYLAMILLVALLLVASCTFQPIRDDRPPDVRAATQTALASEPVSGNVHVLRIRLLTPPPATIEPALAPTATLPTVTPNATACLQVKANIDAHGRKLYHLPSMPNYAQVKVDESKGERIFCTEQDAINAGWTKSGN